MELRVPSSSIFSVSEFNQFKFVVLEKVILESVWDWQTIIPHKNLFKQWIINYISQLNIAVKLLEPPSAF